MSYETIIVEKTENIEIIRLNRPQTLNAWNQQMGLEVTEALTDARNDRDVKVVILTGNGRGFSSGADMSSLAKIAENSVPAEGLVNSGPSIVSVALQMRTLEKPIIGAINGTTAGGGFGIALACDIRIASDRAEFTQVFVRRGLVPDVGSTFFLPKLLGTEKALELIFTGDMIDAEKAVEMGLVSRMVPHDELMNESMKLAGRIASGPPIAMGLAKRAVYLGYASSDLPAHLDFELSLNQLCFSTEDFKEGVASFLEKRPPKFQGK
ncbi:MAG: enoyl-CoA hydratase/isomerase family protein [Candidatus Adiutricales bacterium]